MLMKEVKFTRQALYDLVWSESMVSISKKYSISVEGLRKKCRSLSIPFPNAGYWMKLKYGKNEISRIPLGHYDGDPLVTLALRAESVKTDQSKQMKKVREMKKIEIFQQPVPVKLLNPDNLIISAKRDLSNKKPWRDGGIIRNSSGILSIEVSPKNLQRALILMDILIKSIRYRGHEIRVDNNKTVLIFFGEAIPIRCREKFSKKTVKDSYGISSEKFANGLLSLKIDISYPPKEWTDGKKKIEEQLPDIIAYLETKARQERDDRLAFERQREMEKELQRKEKEIQDRKEQELEKFQRVLIMAKRHHNAVKIREYADQMEDNAIKEHVLTEELKSEIEWIRKKADWYDPFLECYDELLSGIDRDELKLKKKDFHLLRW